MHQGETVAKPTVFISSTCRDLAAQRERIISRLSDMGLVPIYSESQEFPVRHGLPATESCYAAVKDNADVMVLVLGMRYGSVDADGVSVTRNEYRQAKASGIPVLVLVDKQALDLAPLVQQNPDLDMSGKVDDVRLFEFLDELLDDDRRWVFPYSKLEDIEGIVVNQLAVLFGECLALYRQLGESDDLSLLQLMGPNSKRVFLARGDLWEYELFGCFLEECFGETELTFKEFERVYGYVPAVTDFDEDTEDIVEFVIEFKRSIHRVLHLTHNWKAIIDNAVNDAMGLPGEPGDPRKLLFAARRLSNLYGDFLDEHNQMAGFKRIAVLEALTDAYCSMIAPALDYMASTPELWQERIGMIRDAIAAELTEVDIGFTIPDVDPEAFTTEIARVERSLGI